MRVVYSPAHLAHDTVTETVMGAVIPANEVAERAERIRSTLEADGGFTLGARPSTGPTRSSPSTIRACSDTSRRPGPRHAPSRSSSRT